MITLVIVVLNELPDSMLQFPRIIIVFQLHDILHGTMIARYLTLGYRVVRCTTSVFYLMVAQVILQFRRDITGPVITE